MSYKEELITQIIEQVKQEAFWNAFETVEEILWELDASLLESILSVARLWQITSAPFGAQGANLDMKELFIRAVDVYGQRKFYPAFEKAETLARIAGTKRWNPNRRTVRWSQAQKLGFKVLLCSDGNYLFKNAKLGVLVRARNARNWNDATRFRKCAIWLGQRLIHAASRLSLV